MAPPLRERARGAAAAAAGPRPLARARRCRRGRPRGATGRSAAATASSPPAAPAPVAADKELLGGIAAVDGARQGDPDARPSRGASRSARLGTAGRPRARARAPDPEADAGAAGAHSRAAPPPPRRGRNAGRCAAATARDVHRHDRVRDRAHLGPRGARLAAAGDRIRPLPAAALARRAGAAAQAAEPGRGDRALPAASVPRAEAVLRRGARRDDPDAGRGDRSRRGRGAPTRSCSGWRTGAGSTFSPTSSGGRYETILREFEGERTIEAVVSTEEGGSGDVKYHLGAQGRARLRAATSRSRWSPTRATSRRSTRSSREGRARSRPIARRARATTIRASPSRS